MYQDMRQRYDLGEDVFEYDWKCPFSLPQLQKIRSKPIDQVVGDEIFARAMLDKYHVDEGETYLGLSTAALVDAMERKIAKRVKVTYTTTL
jgi:hypothetical protein